MGPHSATNSPRKSSALCSPARLAANLLSLQRLHCIWVVELSQLGVVPRTAWSNSLQYNTWSCLWYGNRIKIFWHNI